MDSRSSNIYSQFFWELNLVWEISPCHVCILYKYHTYIHICVSIQVCTHRHIKDICVYYCIYIYIYMFVGLAYVHIYIYVCVCMCIYIYIYVCMWIYTYEYTYFIGFNIIRHTHTYIYIYNCLYLSSTLNHLLVCVCVSAEMGMVCYSLLS